MARWGDDKTLQFVILYRNHECLWNPKSSQYKNNILRNNAYEDMIMKMNDPTLSLKSLKTKIKNLRSVYHNELKKIEHSKRSGSGTAEVYNPSTSWFHEMHSFLGDTGDYRTSIELNVEDSSQDSQSSDPVSNSNPMTPQSVSLNVSSPSPSLTTEDRPQSRSSSNPSKRRKKGVLEEGSITCALDRLENLTSVINRPTEYDEFHYFAQNVAAQLRALPLYAALDLQTEIQTLLIAARRQHLYPNMSPFTQKMIYTPPTTNILPTMTYTHSTTNQQTKTHTLPNTHTPTITYTPPTINTQTMTDTPPITNIQTMTNIPPTTNTQIMTDTPSTTNTQAMTYTDLLTKAWEQC
ncbi:unnamed protein product [Acanthoscelides obtectus]|uniref:MADF domain-containing protein n=1 Tax=Acanthoscelides obtectus TaxID=200917 RepID=A0A9P0PA78_ACAOB|nr:unnamed protein product [Acanthoscelides obtectus]CAK1623629.1 hypothetical protein AOBTE_LOCUS2099 [Acanthoscelides obtectus]